MGRVVGFRVQAEFIGVEHHCGAPAVICAVVAVSAEFDPSPALSTTMFVFLVAHFFIFTRRVKLMVRFANFSKPCTRRIAFLSARGFAMFILRLRTHLERVALSR